MFVSMFFPVFLGIVIILFFGLPARLRPAVLLFSSYAFCAKIDLRALAVLLAASAFGWAAGLFIEKLQKKGQKKRRNAFLISALILCLLTLCLFKYSGHLIERFGLKNLSIPVGLSFYLFQVIAYLIDIARGKNRAEKNFLYLGCYFAFFAKLTSGPIERAEDFLPQLKRLHNVKFQDRGRLSAAFSYILWGYFMKLVVADRLALLTDVLFGNVKAFDSLCLAAGVLLYTVQIYCDFAGYSYLAMGCAKIFGIDLTQNFKAPYQAENIMDFWRRWHISLSLWLRDYLYIPLGGNRKGIFRKSINTMIVFLACGMWHGAGLNFFIWGMLHGVYSIIGGLLQSRGKRLPGSRIVTFMAVAFAWIFFRAESLEHAWLYVSCMLTTGFHPKQWKEYWDMLQLNIVEAAVIGIGILFVWYVDRLCSRRKMDLPLLIQHKQSYVRYLVFYLLLITILVFGMYGPGYYGEQFIYMEF